LEARFPGQWFQLEAGLHYSVGDLVVERQMSDRDVIAERTFTLTGPQGGEVKVELERPVDGVRGT
jgi:hypothetical protein